MTHYHKHHIIPKHAGGTDDPSNLIKLTLEEHVQAHLDLYNEHGDERDLLAHRMLLGQITNKEANAIIRKLPKSDRWKSQMSERMSGEGNPMYGKTLSEEQIEALRIINKGNKYAVGNTNRLGTTHTKETKEKISMAKKGVKLSKEHKAKLAEAQTGRVQPQSQKDKVSKALSKQWKITDPEGNVFIVENLQKFARDNNLDQGNLARGGNGSHKKYKAKRLQESVTN